MSDLKRGLGIEETRAWLDRKGFVGKFVDWESDALLGADKSGLLIEVPGLEGERLWGLLNTARTSSSSNQGDRELLIKISEENQKISQENQKISQENQKISRKVTSVSKVLLQDACPRAPSGATERSHHQAIMKQEARVRYQCIHPTDPSQTKCMLLGLYFPTHQVTNSHIISLRNRNALSRLGLPDECIWDARNGLLLFEAFETKLENLEITFLLNPTTQIYSFQVLYDDLLTKDIPVAAAHLFPGRNGNLTYGDLIGRPLILPLLVFPFRRCLYWNSYYAYRGAMQSRRAHSCAESSNPTEEQWEFIRKTVATDSICGDELAFLSDEEDEI